ncbi:MAG TPA: cyclic beta 1-2 glucan synthetase, partial [Pirellulales bacterium]|nr:cyclic beta 1-2 glucan synthetase [Pirellulales bacterium]
MGRSPDKLLPRLDENERILIEAYDLVTAAAERSRRIEPAAEWLLDNFYLVEEQIRAIRRLLPPSYSRELPRLATGSAATLPRAYGIALELIAHVDGRVDAVSLNGFVAAYQSVESLKLGELWGLPLMLRLALIENLRRVAVRIAAARHDRNLAADWADRMIRVVEQTPTDLILVLADMARANPPLSGAFLSELTRHLQGQNPNFAFANSWLEHRLADQGLTTEQLVRAEGQSQAADQVSIGNSISSLRFLGTNNWRKFVEEHSLVEQTLSGDPARIYRQMDFATRDRYRHAVEGIARRSRLTEYDVARKAVQLAENQAIDRPHDRMAHVGYYLVDRGRPALERLVEMQLSPQVILDKLRRRYPMSCYLSSIGGLTTFATLTFLWHCHGHGADMRALLLMAMPALMCSAHLSVGIVNWLATLLLSPQSLPRIDYEQGVPHEQRTLVVVPTMLGSSDGIERLLEGLEIRYLANRDEGLHFALLTDFIDAPTGTMPADAELVRQVRAGIERLNQKYEDQRANIFYLFHRARRWNAQEGIWMGYERKRGKLADLNAMLRGAPGRFAETVGDTAVLQAVQYVITLDTDTHLPRDAAREMVGTLAHLLNRPVYDPQRKRVIDGYTILQPRVGVSLPSAQRSRFVQLFAGDPGVDPYTRVVSDVYQDLFGEGSFIGKGIYDVDSFEQLCGDFPENTILSHDLLEGAYARSALLSDVTLYEDHPSRYGTDIDRRHRWMRGDWQIASWLFPSVSGRHSRRVGNPISALSWWKIFDNLRRSLVPVAMLTLLLVSWFISTATAIASLVFLIVVVVLPALLSALIDIQRKPIDLPPLMHLRATAQSLSRALAQGLFTLICLPYEAYVSLDAIVRTWVRVGWTKRKLLEWKTAGDSERGTQGSLVDTVRSMMPAPALAILMVSALAILHPDTLPIAALLLGLWFASPVVAWWLSRPIRPKAAHLTEPQWIFLNKLARNTWRYFEMFVTADDNWLPPDNVQQNPDQVVAPRTSPTNIGMGLLADLASYDFGYSSASQLLDRTEKTLRTLARMDRYRGHFFNWYDTRSLAPLTPRYVSTVDSGNLAANLLVLASGYEELTDANILPQRLFNGLRDTLRSLLDVARGDGSPLVSADVLRRIERQIEDVSRAPTTIGATTSFLARLQAAAGEIAKTSGHDQEFAWWANAYERSCSEHRQDLLKLASWSQLPAPPDELWKQGSPEQLQRFVALRALLKKLDTAVTLREVAALPRRTIGMMSAILE